MLEPSTNYSKLTNAELAWIQDAVAGFYSVLTSHIQVDTFTTTEGTQTFTASKSTVRGTILLIINGQPLTPTTDWTFVSPNQATTVSSDFPIGFPSIWVYIY